MRAALASRPWAVGGLAGALFFAFIAALWAMTAPPSEQPPAAPPPPEPVPDVAKIIIVAPDQDPERLEGGAIETQADFAYYLNEFAVKTPDTDILVTPKEELKRFFHTHTPFEDDYAVIFMKGDKAYYCEGQFFEAFLYEMGLAKLDDPAADEGYEGILKPFQFTPAQADEAQGAEPEPAG
ncbi:MAG: hypothetical protein AAGL49_03685 [Pseudomonadota bacterium]